MALNPLEARYWRTARKVIAGVLHNPSDVDEVLGQAMQRAASRIGQYKGEVPLENWVAQVARSVALNALRKIRRRAQTEVPISEQDYTRDPFRETEDLIEIERRLDGLPFECRQILVLVDVIGYKVHEAATELGLSNKKGFQLLGEARSRLKGVQGVLILVEESRQEDRCEECLPF